MHPDAGPAARAMQAAGRQGKAWEMEEKLFEHMRELKPENLETYAGEVGLDVAKFKSDLESDAVKKEIDDDMAAGKSGGVRGTPSIFVNGQRFMGQRTLEGFKAVIDEEIKKADELIKKGTPIDKVYETLSKSSS